ncbi:MAG: ABC transporter substrate-binding protein [archaeon]|jgi:branched-chain amino acid transport system substrate-binding protein
MNVKTTVIGVIALVVISLLFLAISPNATGNFGVTASNEENIKIGAVLALSGPSTIWGESVRNGMELALLDHPNLTVDYEDSKGTAADGISAYQKLKLEEPDIYVSALSIVSVPLSTLAKEDKKVMIITQSAANNITNEYAFRYYTDANHFATPSFESENTPLMNVKKIAVVFRNDEYAKSVAAKIKELSTEQGKEIVFMESYTPNETDFSTILAKAKATNPEALLFVPTPPSESLAILKKVNEMDFNIPIVEVSNVQSDPETQAKAPKMTFYTNEFAFSIPGNNEEFKTKYKAKFGKEPNFVAAFGYDIINLIASCPKDKMKECLENKNEVSGVTGVAKDITNNDIVLPMFLERVN